jgi:hypothetical protein
VWRVVKSAAGAVSVSTRRGDVQAATTSDAASAAVAIQRTWWQVVGIGNLPAASVLAQIKDSQARRLG